MRLIRSACAFAMFLLTAGCERVELFLVNFPGYFASTRVTRDIAYGAAANRKLDIYVPEAPAGASRQVIVFFYGGRWTSGSKDIYGFVGNAFAKHGFIVVIPDYAKYPAVRFPTFVEDGAAALAWVYRNIASYGGDPTRIHVAGHSSGAHIGALLAADAHYLRDEGLDRSAVIRDFAGLAGPYAFTPDAPDLEDMFGPPARYPAMQVTTFIDGTQPPMLLLWGAADTLVGKVNMDRVSTAIHAKGGCLDTKIYPGTGHIGIVAALSWLNYDRASVLPDMLAYFNAPRKARGCPDTAAVDAPAVR